MNLYGSTGNLTSIISGRPGRIPEGANTDQALKEGEHRGNKDAAEWGSRRDNRDPQRVVNKITVKRKVLWQR